MKNFKNVFLALMLALVSLFTFAGGGKGEIKKANAASNNDIVYFSLDYDSSVLEIDTLTYYFDGLKIEYSSSGFVNYIDLDKDETIYHVDSGDGVSKAYYKITYDGVTEQQFGLFVEGIELTLFYATEPYYNATSLPQFSECGIEKNNIPRDSGSDLAVTFKYKTDVLKKSAYVSKLSYKLAPILETADIHNIDSGSYDKYGVVSYNARFYDEESLSYKATINSFYNFEYKEIEGGFDIFLAANPSTMTLKVETAIKWFNVNIEGDAANIATIEGGTLDNKFTYGDVAKIILTPSAGKIIKTVEIINGDATVLTLYGGMQTEDNYYFAGGTDYSTKFSYANFAIGYEAMADQGEDETSPREYLLDREVVGEASIYREEKLDNNDYFKVTLDGSGVVTIEKEVVDREITIKVTEQSFLQVNLFKKADEESELELSTQPFSEISLNNQVLSDGYLPRLFIVGVDDSIPLSITLNIGYSYDDSMDISFISGNVYSRLLEEGGSLDIIAYIDDSCSISVKLMQDGNLFVSGDTKIYIALNDPDNGINISGDTVEERLASFKALLGNGVNSASTSFNGNASMKEIRSGTLVYVCVRISPYYMMTTSEGGTNKSYAYEYIKEVMVTGADTIEFEINLLAFEGKPVVYTKKDGNMEVWRLKLTVTKETDADGNIDYNYTTLIMNSRGMYSNIQKNNPLVVGYNFSNLAVNGITFLNFYENGSVFQVPEDDTAIHKFIAEFVFGAEAIDALFDPQIYSFNITYTNAEGEDKVVVAKIYYDSNIMYLAEEIIPPLEYTYFGGISYMRGSSRVNVYTSGDNEVIKEVEGEFIDLYKYELELPWQIESGTNLFVNAIFLNKSYDLTISYVYADGSNKNQVNKVEYGSEFIISSFRNEEFLTPTIEGMYNLVGWKIEGDDTIIYEIDGVTDFLDNTAYTYDVVGGIRIIPVFSAKEMTITFMNGMNAIHEVSVRYDDIVNLEDLLMVEGEYIIPSQYAYSFLGFYTERDGGREVISYTEGADPVYNINYEDNLLSEFLLDGLFGINEIDGKDEYVWKIQENRVLYVKWNADFLKLNIYVNDNSLRENADVNVLPLEGDDGAHAWSVEEYLSENHFVVRDFIITESFNVVGFKAINYHFISSVIIGGEEVYSAYSNDNGEIVVTDGFVLPSYFNPEQGSITIVASDFFTEDNDLSELDIVINYSVVTQVVTFVAKAVDDNGQAIASYGSKTQKYLVSYYYNTIDGVAEWVQLSSDGEVTTDKGWVNLSLSSNIILTEGSLYGDSSLYIIGNEGKKYGFRGWKNTDDASMLLVDTILIGENTYETVFSFDFDVELNYYVFNSSFNSYQLNTTVGQFWVYDKASNSYVINPITALNAYEVYTINSLPQYIKCWTAVPSGTAIIYDNIFADSYISLNSEIDFDYDSNKQVLNLYAVYNRVTFTFMDLGTEIDAVVDIPNDPSGNSYNEVDITWISMNQTMYENLRTQNLALRDSFTQYFMNNASAFSTATISSGATISDATLRAAGRDENSTYLIMVATRKIDGEANTNEPYVYFVTLVGLIGDILK